MDDDTEKKEPETKGKSKGPKKSPKATKRGSRKSGKKQAAIKQKLKFPVSDIHKMLSKGRALKNVDPQVAVYLAAVEEYVAHEIVELAGNHAVNRKSRQIDAEDVLAVIRSDQELYNLVGEFVED